MYLSRHRALKSQTTYLRPHCLGDPALGSTFPHVRALSAPLLRHYGPPGASAPYLAPLRRPELLPRLFPHLTSLDISGQDLGPSRLRLLLPLAPRLQHLDASACRLCPRDAAALGCLTALQSLAFNHVVPVPDQPGAGGRAAADDWSSSAPAGWDTQHGDEAGGGDAADPDGDGGDWTVGSDDDGSGAAAALAEALAGALPRLQRLRRLELDADDPASPPAPPPAAGFLHLAINPAAAAEAAAAAAAAAAAPNPFNAAVPLEDLDELDVDGDPDLAAAALFGHAPPPPPPSPRGIPLLHHAACLAALPSLRCLRLRGNALSAADLAHVASCTALTELALLWNPRRQGLQLSVSCWAALLAALPRLEVLDVDFAGWDVRERMSLVPLRAQQGGTQPPGGAAAADGGTAGAAGAHAGAGLANRQQQQQQQQIQAARAGAGRTAQRGGGTGASGAGGRGEAVAAGGGGRAGGSGPLGCLRSLSLRQCNSPDLVLSVMACGGALTRLELPAAGEHVTPYLVAQVGAGGAGFMGCGVAWYVPQVGLKGSAECPASVNRWWGGHAAWRYRLHAGSHTTNSLGSLAWFRRGTASPTATPCPLLPRFAAGCRPCRCWTLAAPSGGEGTEGWGGAARWAGVIQKRTMEIGAGAAT